MTVPPPGSGPPLPPMRGPQGAAIPSAGAAQPGTAQPHGVPPRLEVSDLALLLQAAGRGDVATTLAALERLLAVPLRRDAATRLRALAEQALQVPVADLPRHPDVRERPALLGLLVAAGASGSGDAETATAALRDATTRLAADDPSLRAPLGQIARLIGAQLGLGDAGVAALASAVPGAGEEGGLAALARRGELAPGPRAAAGTRPASRLGVAAMALALAVVVLWGLGQRWLAAGVVLGAAWWWRRRSA